MWIYQKDELSDKEKSFYNKVKQQTQHYVGSKMHPTIKQNIHGPECGTMSIGSQHC